ncbi:MAG: plasmid mobilization relaxosome protein MobC [Blautia sp.]|nr:plasmid mobilization relaxosome protein MobC [Blautia sp.]
MAEIGAIKDWRNPMARPKKEKDEKYSRSVTMYFTDSQYELLSEQAASAGLSISSYIRKMVMEGRLLVTYDVVADATAITALTAEYGKIGSNLNQIAKYFHTGGSRSMAMENEIRTCINDLYRLRKEMIGLAGEFHGSAETHHK